MAIIDGFVAEQLTAWEVPGCAAAAVKDGKVVLAAGWGQRDLEARLPVTADTLFAIGSATKAFTAATVGALVDDGLLEWERPLREYVPEILLHDTLVTDRLTIVDLLSHRSGLPPSRDGLARSPGPVPGRDHPPPALPAPQQGPAPGVPVLQSRLPDGRGTRSRRSPVPAGRISCAGVC
jgi:CubicO group peptidase (beta-lactamase class C family)